MANTLYIGNRNYSSWSLRPWLALRWAGIAFEERLIDLAQPGYGDKAIAEITARNPAGQVPFLDTGTMVIWDTLAICEWAYEKAPSLWPEDTATRAMARSATAEMHSGFVALRRDLPCNIQRRSAPQPWPDDTQRNLVRLFALWRSCRERFGAAGPWLLGTRSIADAFYTPVATRLRSYGVALDPDIQAYAETLLGDADFLHWEKQCLADSWDRPGYPVIDGLYR